jgi:molecular chaperone DnaJ
MPQDHYATLGVSRTATQDEIKRAYRKLAHLHHPDKNQGNPESEKKFKEINNSYEILSDEKKRANFDRYGDNYQNVNDAGAGFGFDGVQFDFQDFGGFGGIDDIFDSFFGGGNRKKQAGSTESARMKGVDIEVNIELTLQEIAKGASKVIDYEHRVVCTSCEGKGYEAGSKMKTCPTCNAKGKIFNRVETIFGIIQQESLCPTCEGVGKIPEIACKTCSGKGFSIVTEKLDVEIPVGVSNGDRVKVAGKGQAGYRGSISGDLYLRVIQKNNEVLRREGLDVYTTATVNYLDFLVGTAIDVETVWGVVEVQIPQLTNPEGKLRLKEQGMPRLNNGSKRGDHYVELKITMPKKLTNEDLNKITAIRNRVVD